MLMTPEVERAWQKANDAWKAAGGKVPCYEPAYMLARAELAVAVKKADAEVRRRRALK